jgi:hypothetical protein
MYSANKVCQRIKTTLEAYDAGGGVKPFEDKVHNHFGGESNIDLNFILQQVGHIYIFWEGDDFELEAGHTIKGRIYLQFLIIEQTLGAAATKYDYPSDTFRAYIASGQWRQLGIPTDYPNDNYEVFMLTGTRVTRDADARGNPTDKSLIQFRGYIDFHQDDLSGP